MVVVFIPECREISFFKELFKQRQKPLLSKKLCQALNVVRYEKRLLKEFGEKVTLFTAGHHGSSTSNTKEFISAVNPDFIAVSAGKDNEYGHPHNSVIKRFEENGIPYGITFRDGTIVYSITDNKLLTKQGG